MRGAFEHAQEAERATEAARYALTESERAEGIALGLSEAQMTASKKLGMGLLDYASFLKIRNWTDFQAYKAAKKAAQNAKP